MTGSPGGNSEFAGERGSDRAGICTARFSRVGAQAGLHKRRKPHGGNPLERFSPGKHATPQARPPCGRLAEVRQCLEIIRD